MPVNITTQKTDATKPDVKRLNFHIQAAMYDRLQAKSSATGLPVPMLIRFAIDAYLKD